MLFRYFGAYEQGAVFAILLINAVAGPLDRLAWKLTGEERNTDEDDEQTDAAGQSAQ